METEQKHYSHSIPILDTVDEYCGFCSAYKTPFCTFALYNDVITKKDQACVDFYPDRHVSREKLKKPKVVQRRVE